MTISTEEPYFTVGEVRSILTQYNIPFIKFDVFIKGKTCPIHTTEGFCYFYSDVYRFIQIHFLSFGGGNEDR